MHEVLMDLEAQQPAAPASGASSLAASHCSAADAVQQPDDLRGSLPAAFQLVQVPFGTEALTANS